MSSVTFETSSPVPTKLLRVSIIILFDIFPEDITFPSVPYFFISSSIDVPFLLATSFNLLVNLSVVIPASFTFFMN